MRKKQLHWLSVTTAVITLTLSLPMAALATSSNEPICDPDYNSLNNVLYYCPSPPCGPSNISDTLGSGRVSEYKNPVIGHTAPDPSVIYGDDGKFHLYTTGFQHFISDDMVNWKKQTSNKEGWINIQEGPGWTTDRWAPDIAKIDDIYVLSISGRSSGDRKIGYATSESANGPFKYQGELLHPDDRGKHGMGYDIDPNIIQTNSGIFLYYGSGLGTISAAKLTRNGNKLSAGNSKVIFTTKHGLAPVKAEGPFVHKRGDYYYLYFSSGNWKNESGGSDAYRQHVARSINPLGPFEEKSTPIIESNGAFKSPGHGSVITDSTGNDWKVYMAYPKNSSYRTVVIDRIDYKNDWPVINDGKGPSSGQQSGSINSISSTVANQPAEACICEPTNSNATVSLTGKNNVENAFSFFVQQGLSPAQSAGIVGNLMTESSPDINPEAKNGTNYYGIAQWSTSDRWPRLVEWAKGQDKDEWKFQTQLEYLWKEATDRGNIEGIKKQPDVDHAAWYWGRYFEVAIVNSSTSETPLTNVQALDDRMNYANQVLNDFGGTDTPPATAAGADSCGSDEASGFTDIDGIKMFYQVKEPWASDTYGIGTIKECGCGPTSLAIAAATLSNINTNPKKMSDWFVENSGQQGGGKCGSNWIWDSNPSLFESEFKLSISQITNSADSIKEALQTKGNLVLMSQDSKGIFTSGGHIMLARGVTNKGKILVADPNSEKNTTKADGFTDSQITDGLRQAWVIKSSK